MADLKTITPDLMSKMIISGANNLLNNKKVLNDLNVFPVPDGDTGTNMTLTINAAAAELKKFSPATVGEVADIVANASLRGARGNSGVILSQIFRGISKALKGKSEIDAGLLGSVFSMASDTAYRAVMKPTEGTILTVAREAAEAAQSVSNANNTILTIFESALNGARDALAKTPEMLPQLKQAGVVDAGGQGLVYILEGAFYTLKTGEVTEHTETLEDVLETELPKDTVADIKYMYCTEFIIEKQESSATVGTFRQSIEKKGDSMLVIDDGDVVKVHIHTNNPGYVMEKAIKLGQLINIKIDNMKYQHDSITVMGNGEPAEEIKHEKYAFISVAMGDGIKQMFKDLNVSQVIEGGQTMNPSTEDVLKAINKVNADTIYVLPNNKNIILAAEQAKSISDKNIAVLNTTSVPEAIGALLAFNAEDDPKQNLKAMNAAIKRVKTGQVTYAVRDTQIEKTKIKIGDIMGLVGKKVVSVGSDPAIVCKDLIRDMAGKNASIITVFYGADVKEEKAKALISDLEESYPDIDVILYNGGQPLYYYIVSVE